MSSGEGELVQRDGEITNLPKHLHPVGCMKRVQPAYLQHDSAQLSRGGFVSPAGVRTSIGCVAPSHVVSVMQKLGIGSITHVAS
jgi:hypothetical protein